MTEQQQYEVVSTFGSVELRRYARCTVADVVMQGSASSVGSQAFRPLVRYISSAQLSMTAPVLQASTSSPASSSSSDSWVVSFVLPGSKGIGDYPLPTDAQITLREIPEHLALATAWSGRWSYSSVESNTAALLSVLSDPGSPLSATYVQVGSPVWARYDPPWKPWFLRRNEVLIEVRTLEHQ
jgi:hypothetical protein